MEQGCRNNRPTLGQLPQQQHCIPAVLMFHSHSSSVPGYRTFQWVVSRKHTHNITTSIPSIIGYSRASAHSTNNRKSIESKRWYNYKHNAQAILDIWAETQEELGTVYFKRLCQSRSTQKTHIDTISITRQRKYGIWLWPMGVSYWYIGCWTYVSRGFLQHWHWYWHWHRHRQ